MLALFNRNPIILVLCTGILFSNKVVLASQLKPETAKGAQPLTGSASSKMLYGNVNESKLRSLEQYASFGFLCTKEGKTELPAKVTSVTLRSMAYWQGLKIDDRIIKLQVNKNIIELSVERAGKTLPVTLSDEHPFIPAEIAKTGLNGVIQKNYADCWFDGVLAAVASSAAGQKLIASMIRQTSPTLYYITFLDQPNIAWPVDLSTIQHYQLDNKALWASLLEQASLLRFSNNHLDGGKIEDAVVMLTGKNVGLVSPTNIFKIPPGSKPMSLSQMADIINRAMLNHEPMVVGTKGAFILKFETALAAYKEAGINLSLDANGLPTRASNISREQAMAMEQIRRDSLSRVPPLILWGDHTYTVTDFDPNTNLITLRNPFGTDTKPSSVDWAGTMDADARNRLVQDLGNGVIRLKLDVLYRYMTKLVWTDL